MAEKLDADKFVQLFLKGYAPKSKDEDKFAKKHVAKRDGDRNGNGDDVFNAANVPEYDRTKGRHGYKTGDDEAVYEAALSPAEMRQREKIVRAMKRSGDFKKRYGKDAKAVMYATATKLANEGFVIEEDHDEDAVIYVDDLIETLAEIEEARTPRKAKHHTDPYSQPPSPNNVEAEGDRKKRFADVSVVEQILLQMTEEVVEVHFEDGDTALLDAQAATDIIEAYLNLDEESQQTFDSTLSEGIEGFEAGMSFLAPAVDELDEAKEDYSKSTDISKLRKMLARHSDMAIKYNGAGDDEKVKYHQVQMNKIKRRMGVLVREDLDLHGIEYDMLGEETLDEKYGKYIATSEPSKMSTGHRAKLLAPEGHVSYLSQKVYKTPKHARDAATYYHDLSNQRLHYGAMDRKMGEYNKAYDEKHGIKEDVEQIDEISDKTLGRYIGKAVVDVHNDAKWAGETDDLDARNKAFKRLLGVKSAAARLSKQDISGGRIGNFRRMGDLPLYKEEALHEVSPELKVRYAEARFKDLHDKRMSGDIKKMSPKKVQRQVDRATKAWNQGMDVIRSERSTFKDPLAGMKPYRRQDYDEYGNMREGVEALAEISADVARLVQQKREGRARAADLRGDVDTGHAEMKKAATAKRRADEKEAMKEGVEVVSEVDKAKYIRAAVDDISTDSNYQGWKYGTKHPKDPINRSDTSAREEKRRKGIDLAMRLMQRGKK